MLDFNKVPKYSEYLNYVGRECETQLRSIDIPCGEVMIYTPHSERRVEWGECRNVGSRKFIISINEVLLQKKYLNGLKSTLFHELLHTCPECYNHGSQWERYGVIVEKKLGISINQHDDYRDKGVSMGDYMKAHSYKYAIKCKKCGFTYFRQRKTKFTKNYKAYRCGSCGGELYEDMV